MYSILYARIKISIYAHARHTPTVNCTVVCTYIPYVYYLYHCLTSGIIQVQYILNTKRIHTVLYVHTSHNPFKKMFFLGFELAGEVVEVGSQVSRFKPSDRVLGIKRVGSGSFGQYCALFENVRFELAFIRVVHYYVCTHFNTRVTVWKCDLHTVHLSLG